MATVEFVPAPGTHRTATGALVLRVAAAPTTSYVATTNDAACVGWEIVKFGIDYINGDETSIQLKAQGYDGAGWRDLAYKATQATAVSEVTPDVLQLTKATFSTAYGAGQAGAIMTPSFDCLGMQKVRMVVKSTGGTPTGTIAVSANAAILVKRA
jgi:hypothetical protein